MEVLIKEGVNGHQIFEIVMQNLGENLSQALNFIDQQKRFDQLIAIACPDVISTYSKNYPHFSWQTEQSLKAKQEENLLQSYLVISEDSRPHDLVYSLPFKTHVTTLYIELDAIAHNLEYYRNNLRPETKVMVMVKALAYGTGLLELSHFLTKLNVDFLCVAFTDEGVKLRQEGIELPILVLNTSLADLPNLVHYDLETELYDLEQIKQFIAYCENHDCHLNGHVMINTGMNRLGFAPPHMDALKRLLIKQKVLNIKGCMTHLAASSDPTEEDFTHRQFSVFEEAYKTLFSDPEQQPPRHVLNSGGILRYPDQQYDMVRLGIGLYGIEVNDWSQNKLQVVSRLQTKISQLHQLDEGETVGYGRAGKITQPSTIAILPIGYGDGYLRDYGMGRAYVLINNHQARTVGNICMDMCMVDVTGIDVQVGDEAILFGEDLPISQLAQWSNSIPYEVLTQVSERVQRVFIKRF